MLPALSAGKYACVTRDWFCFCFSLAEPVSGASVVNQSIITKANGDYFPHLNENWSIAPIALPYELLVKKQTNKQQEQHQELTVSNQDP